ncbi:DinB family protein [Streptomyces sp. H27-H1]|uniref:mycothiol transferase n=1 Tax=Streptomyces sp. H27-H1 TaxID=2996461 RepID=UPI002271B777|nr:DinB family protein [Streptomyces sp. H27-H1]MCY0929881.1 DinB family protein [Streptomyces sp. H27-H1]
MKGTEVLADAFGRIQGVVHEAVEGLEPEQLNARIDPGANSIAWLVWHLTRIQDDHVADAAGRQQVWHAQGWDERFGLELPPGSTGYGHTAREAGAVRVGSGELLLGYHDAVHAQTGRFLRGLSAADLDRVVDEQWDPPVTLGVRLVSVIGDDLQHAGQAAFARGVLTRGR